MHTVLGDGNQRARGGIRRDQVALTERRILDAATALFVERGYAATSLPAVAAAAGVSPRTIHVRFHSKARLLERCIELGTIAGPTASALDGDRAQGLDEPILDARIETIVALAAATMERSGALLALTTQAAAIEPEIAAMERVGMQRTLGELRAIGERLAEENLLPARVSAAAITDILWVIAGPRTIVSLMNDRGWTPARYATWLDATLRAFLRR